MTELWGSLVPLILGSALVPVQIIVTLVLLRSSGGVRTALAWVGGMTLVRLLQGLLFGLVFSSSDESGTGAADQGVVVSTVLLVMALLFYVTAARQVLGDDDPDAPPPRWMTMTASMTPGKAFLVGAGYLVIAAKFWVFTLGAVGAIAEADLGRSASVATFLAFVVLAESAHLAAIGAAALAPQRSARLLGRASDWLTRHNKTIVTVLGLVFGTWFLVKGLTGLGVI
jgi:hypothetical protein